MAIISISLKKECVVQEKITFSEAARRNKRLKPIFLEDVDYMSLKDALKFLSNIKDNSVLKTLLEDKVWYSHA